MSTPQLSETIRSKANNCTLVAVQEVTRLPDDVIFKAFREHGYRDNKGMPNYMWIKVAKSLGCELLELNTRVACERETYLQDGTRCVGQYSRFDTLGAFLKNNRVGTFFVSVPGHALVIREGKVVDHNRRRNLGLRRRVTFAHRVLNAPEVKVEYSKFLSIPRFYVKNRKSAAYVRWTDAIAYLRNNQNVTAAELIRNTQYTLADFRHDFKKGLIVYKPITDGEK